MYNLTYFYYKKTTIYKKIKYKKHLCSHKHQYNLLFLKERKNIKVSGKSP